MVRKNTGSRVNNNIRPDSGACGMASHCHRSVPLLKRAGSEAIAVDIPGDDPNIGLSAYADLVITAIAKHTDVILVAHSMGPFTAALVSKDFQARVEGKRLGIGIDVILGSRLISLSHVHVLADLLLVAGSPGRLGNVA